MDSEFMAKIKEQVSSFLNQFMPIAEMLEIVQRIDLDFPKYGLTVYKVGSIIRIDIKDKELDKKPD
jgi:hypothetical protein